MNHILLQKQEPIFPITKSVNQYANTKAEISDEIEPLAICEKSIVVFDDMLLSKQESSFDLFFTRGRHNIINFYYVFQSYFHLPKSTIRNNSKIIILFKQTLRDNILFFHDIAGLDMILKDKNIIITRSLEMIIIKRKENLLTSWKIIIIETSS